MPEKDWVQLGVSEGYRPCRTHWEIYGCYRERDLFIIAVICAVFSGIGTVCGLIALWCRIKRRNSSWKAAEVFSMHVGCYHAARLLVLLLVLTGAVRNNDVAGELLYAIPYTFLYTSCSQFGAAIINAYTPQRRAALGIRLGARTIERIAFVYMLVILVSSYGCAIGAGVLRNSGYYNAELAFLKTENFVYAAGTAICTAIISYYGTRLQMLVTQRAGVITQFGTGGRRVEEQSEVAEAGIIRLRLSNERIRIVSRTFGIISVTIPIVLLLRGILLSRIYNDSVFSMLIGALTDLPPNFMFMIIELLLVVSLLRQFLHDAAIHENSSRNHSSDPSKNASNALSTNDQFTATDMNVELQNWKRELEEDDHEYGQHDVSMMRPSAGAVRMPILDMDTSVEHHPVLPPLSALSLDGGDSKDHPLPLNENYALQDSLYNHLPAYSSDVQSRRRNEDNGLHDTLDGMPVSWVQPMSRKKN